MKYLFNEYYSYSDSSICRIKLFENNGGDTLSLFDKAKIIHSRRVFGKCRLAKKYLNHNDIKSAFELLISEKKKSSKKIIISNGHDNSLSIIDPVEDKVLNTIAVGGVPEAAASDDSGKLFVNLEDKNEIVVVDTKTFKVINRYSLFPGEGPTGLVYDKKNRRLFSGCQGLLIIMNADNGKIIDKIKIGNGCDGVVFDESNQTIYTSNGEGNISVIKQENENVYYLLPQILTKKGARTIAIDKSTHLLYLPTAEFDPKEVNEKGRPKMKDGTFQILVIGE